MTRRLVLSATIAVVAVGAAAAAGRMFTTAEVKRFFRAETGVRITRLASASTDAVTTLTPGISPPKRVVERFGRFEIYVLAPATQGQTRRALLGSVRPNRKGIYWERDQQGGWVAYTAYGGNVLVGWFPKGGVHRVDARWSRLHAVMRQLR
jgi:hypothetical protein